MNRIIDNARKCYSILEGINSYTPEDASEGVSRCRIDAALTLLKEIDSEVIDATLSLVMNRELTCDQFYFLRSLNVLTLPSDLEYEGYLTALKGGTFSVDRRTQFEAAAAWVGVPRHEDNSRCEQAVDGNPH